MKPITIAPDASARLMSDSFTPPTPACLMPTVTSSEPIFESDALSVSSEPCAASPAASRRTARQRRCMSRLETSAPIGVWIS